MHQTGQSSHPALHRRRVLHLLLAGTGVALCTPARRGAVQLATPASQSPDLARLFPHERELPAGLALESAGARTEAGQLAGTFRNPRDAATLLAGWGWLGNAYRSYAPGPGAGAATPARIEISLHQFRSSTGAAYALSYFAHDRAVALHLPEEPIGLLLPCEATVAEDGAATRYLRSRNLLVRVTVVMPRPGEAHSIDATLATATDLALAVLAQAGRDAQAMNDFC